MGAIKPINKGFFSSNYEIFRVNYEIFRVNYEIFRVIITKFKAIEKARKEKDKQISEKIQNAINLLKLYNKKITIYSISKEARISYQTAKKFIEKNENLKKIIEN